MRALVVDDNPVNLAVAEAMMVHAGFETVVVTNGADALEAYTVMHFDVVVTDFNMPGMNGAQLVREIRRAESKAKLSPVLILGSSASTDSIVNEMFKLAGVDMILDKPLVLADIQSAVQKYFPKKSS